MSDITLTVKTASIPSGFCFQNWSTSWPELAQLLSVVFPMANGGIHISETPPSAQYQDWPWLKINSSTHKPERIYTFNQGDWVAPYETPSSAYLNLIWTGTESALYLLDNEGGETDPTKVTDRSGPFWEINTDLSGRMPLGVGYIGGINTNTNVALADTGGEEKHTITIHEITDHNHVFGKTGANNDIDVLTFGQIAILDKNGTAVTRTTSNVPGESSPVSTGSTTVGNLVTGNVNPISVANPHQNMPPYYGVYFIKRTARKYYVAS